MYDSDFMICFKNIPRYNNIDLLTGYEGSSKFVVTGIPTFAQGQSLGQYLVSKEQQTCYYPHHKSLSLLSYQTNQGSKKSTKVIRKKRKLSHKHAHGEL